MNPMIKAFALPVIAVALSGAPGFSQEHPDHDQAQSQDRHDNDTYRHHREWKHGAQIPKDDWDRGQKVDYKERHLTRPPQGHEWRKIDGNYVMAYQDGTIDSVRPAPRDHQRSPEQYPQ